MIKSLLGALSLAIVTTPVYAPAVQYEIFNESSATMVWVNVATDEETFIQPYTSFAPGRLTGYALSVYETEHSSTMIIAIDKGQVADRYLVQDLDYSDNLYVTFNQGDTKVTLYDSYYSDDVYLDVSLLNSDPFSDEFYYMFGLNESNYRNLTSSGLVRSHTIFNGNFNIYGDLPSGYNVQYSSLIAFTNVYLVGNTYKKENIRAKTSFIAVRSNGMKAIEIASNYTTSNVGSYAIPVGLGTVLDGYTLYGYTGSNDAVQFRSMQFNFGISNNIWSAGFNVSNPQQAKYLSYRRSDLPPTSTQTEEALDDFFALMAKAFAVLIPFLGVVVLPGVTIGLLLFIPLFVALIIALIKMIKK